MPNRRRTIFRASMTVVVLLAATTVAALSTTEAQAALTSTLHVSGSYNNPSGARYSSVPVGGQYMLRS
jgi:hypothetical protein